jgi:hypothetical protein
MKILTNTDEEEEKRRREKRERGEGGEETKEEIGQMADSCRISALKTNDINDKVPLVQETEEELPVVRMSSSKSGEDSVSLEGRVLKCIKDC